MSSPSPYADWKKNHAAAAAAEGWQIKNCGSKGEFAFQLQPITFAAEEMQKVINLVMCGSQPHHLAARHFLRTFDPAEWKWQCGVAIEYSLGSPAPDVARDLMLLRMTS